MGKVHRWAKKTKTDLARKTIDNPEKTENEKLAEIMDEIKAAKTKFGRGPQSKALEHASNVLQEAINDEQVDKSIAVEDELDNITVHSGVVHEQIYPNKIWRDILYKRDKKKMSLKNLCNRYKKLKNPELAKSYISRKRTELFLKKKLDREEFDAVDEKVWSIVSKFDENSEVLHDHTIRDIAIKQALKMGFKSFKVQ
ncbi:unnamed protein product [Caenorhabditis brenneri]